MPSLPVKFNYFHITSDPISSNLMFYVSKTYQSIPFRINSADNTEYVGHVAQQESRHCSNTDPSGNLGL